MVAVYFQKTCDSVWGFMLKVSLLCMRLAACHVSLLMHVTWGPVALCRCGRAVWMSLVLVAHRKSNSSG